MSEPGQPTRFVALGAYIEDDFDRGRSAFPHTLERAVTQALLETKASLALAISLIRPLGLGGRWVGIVRSVVDGGARTRSLAEGLVLSGLLTGLALLSLVLLSLVLISGCGPP